MIILIPQVGDYFNTTISIPSSPPSGGRPIRITAVSATIERVPIGHLLCPIVWATARIVAHYSESVLFRLVVSASKKQLPIGYNFTTYRSRIIMRTSTGTILINWVFMNMEIMIHRFFAALEENFIKNIFSFDIKILKNRI